MNKEIKKSVVLLVVMIFFIIFIISMFFITKNFNSKEKVNNVIETYSYNNIQEKIDNIIENTVMNEVQISNEVTVEKEENLVNKTSVKPTNNTITKENLILQVDGENTLGVIQINKINFEGLVYEGTSDKTLDKGVGHIESSPYFEGNVCLAAHNTKNLWGNLYTLKSGDTIKYISFLGTKEYLVDSITEIAEDDWTLLENTKENKITLITCIKNEPFKRLCVQAIEKK